MTSTSALRRAVALGSAVALGLAGLAATVPAAAAPDPSTPAPPASEPASAGWSRSVESWVTDLSSDERLAAQPRIAWRTGADVGAGTIVVDPSRRYQTMTGFGASMTDSSAYVLSKLPAKARKKAMRELFSPTDGIGLSMLRQPMGASDFAVDKAYSYDDQPAGKTDPDLSDFSIAHDRAFILPRLREAYALNPRLSFMATPWSAPGWMKDSDSMITGSLLQKYEKAYAQYFVKFVKAYRRAGVPTDFISMQNEPLYEPANYPGMGVMPDQQARFIGRQLAPALDAAGLRRTKILAYDHNWDVPDYPEAVYHDARAARVTTGTAWHCYGGDVIAQSVSHNDYPHAQAFETECSGGEWQGSDEDAFKQTMDSVINVPRNWGQSVVLWNLALDQDNGPFIGGCETCRGVVTTHSDGTVTKNLEFWALGQASRFVRPGAIRVGSSSLVSGAETGVRNVAFRNPDGSLVMIAHNSSDRAQSFDVAVGDRHFAATLAAGAAATYRWSAPARVSTAADLGWVDLDFGRGPKGTPTGRLVQSVGADVVSQLSQVKLGDRWLAYSLPYGAELQSSGTATTLSRGNWTFTSSGTQPVDGETYANLTDDDLSTRWSSGTGQSVGMSLTLDLGQQQTFSQISLNSGTSAGDYLRRYIAQVSDDKTTWRDVAQGPGRTGEMIIALPPTTARYVRLVSDASSGSWWSIHELNLRNAPAADTGVRPGRQLIGDSDRLGDGSAVQGYYNAGSRDASVPWPVDGFGYTYRLPPRAAVTFVVLRSEVDADLAPRTAVPDRSRHGER